ncbi:MAG: cyclase [Candidatus Rokuibacteriota bacterium]|nr:MAG: cyclase [Candidatus Rokubacteria bacterium]
MKTSRMIAVALVIAVLLGTTASAAFAQATTPIGPQWWPSRWGPGDEAGASNLMTPEKVLEAVKLITAGKVYRLGRVYEPGMPMRGLRNYKLVIPSFPTAGPFAKNRLIFNEEFVTGEIGQVGTQFDGLGHIGVLVGADGDLNGMRFYNGFTGADLVSASGLKKLGVEKVKPFFTRGILLDMAGYKGRMLNHGEEITVADVRATMAKQGIADIRPGDVVLFHTGWGSLWMKDNAKFDAGEPGIGLEVARWLADRQIVCVGSDTWATEVQPNPDPNVRGPVHQELLTRNGIFNHENLDLSELARDRVWEFAYVFVPVPLKGATGSPGSPIAIR